MRQATWSTFSFSMALLVAGCSLFPADSGEEEVQEIAFQTDQDRYEATVTGGRIPSVEFTIPITYHNATDADVYLIGCRTPFPPWLEKRVDGEWMEAWVPIVNYCLSPPWRIEPGERRQDTVRVFGIEPGHNAGPTFDTEVPGTYRLVQTLYADPEGEQPLPLTVSNTFRVTRRGH